MSSLHSDQPDQRAGAGLTLNLGSNNPFRNRAASPSTLSLPHSPRSPFDDPQPQLARPVSRNPFLDPALQSPPPPIMATSVDKASPTAEEIFGSLTLDDRKPSPPSHGRSNGPPRGPPPMGRGGPPAPPRGENMPPPGRRAPPAPGHRPTRSQEEALRARRLRENGSAGPSDPSSPQKRTERRVRRNSESSIRGPDRPLTEEEKRAKELRRREREKRHRDAREKDKDGKDKKPSNRRMDIIDQLDATSIFGTGVFHHDGPFDALNPHRNRQGSRRAPMQAFPKDSLNNVLGGSGPLNKRPDHAAFMGHAEGEAFREFATTLPSDKSAKTGTGAVFDPTTRGSILHGDESLGLGTSTFLEGTPAARTVIQRREAEKEADTAESGIQRKKSLAQRIRGINKPGQRDFQPSGRMTNPEGVYAARRSPTMVSPGATSSSVQGGGERNPFFAEFDNKGEEIISVRRADTGFRSPSGADGNPTLERRATSDHMAPEEGGSGKQGGGLMARVKSLKGGRRARDAGPSVPGRDA